MVLETDALVEASAGAKTSPDMLARQAIQAGNLSAFAQALPDGRIVLAADPTPSDKPTLSF